MINCMHCLRTIAFVACSASVTISAAGCASDNDSAGTSTTRISTCLTTYASGSLCMEYVIEAEVKTSADTELRDVCKELPSGATAATYTSGANCSRTDVLGTCDYTYTGVLTNTGADGTVIEKHYVYNGMINPPSDVSNPTAMAQHCAIDIVGDSNVTWNPL